MLLIFGAGQSFAEAHVSLYFVMPRDRKYQTPSVVSPTMARVLTGPGRVEEEAPLGLRDPGEGDIERFLPAE